MEMTGTGGRMSHCCWVQDGVKCQMRVCGDYHADGYALIERLLPPEVINVFLRSMERHLAEQKLTYQNFLGAKILTRGDTIEINGRDYPPMLSLLWGFTPIVSHLVGRELLPSFNYFRIYSEGDICLVHSDRPACQFSLSLTLSYADAKPWPLELGTVPVTAPGDLAGGFGEEPHISLSMMPGDAVLYQGIKQRHGRISPNPNRWSAHLFLHWVEKGGPHEHHAFDAQRQAEVAAEQRAS